MSAFFFLSMCTLRGITVQLTLAVAVITKINKKLSIELLVHVMTMTDDVEQ